MKNNSTFIIIAIIALCLGITSCKSVYYQSRGIAIQNQDIVSTPTVVDIQVDLTKRITYSDDHYVTYPSSSKEQTERLALEAVRYNCITTNNIDVIVDPVYKISFKKNFKKAKVELTGYAGYYQNPRTLYDDVNSLQKFSMDDIKKYILFNNPVTLQNETAPVNITFPSEKK